MEVVEKDKEQNEALKLSESIENLFNQKLYSAAWQKVNETFNEYETYYTECLTFCLDRSKLKRVKDSLGREQRRMPQSNLKVQVAFEWAAILSDYLGNDTVTSLYIGLAQMCQESDGFYLMDDLILRVLEGLYRRQNRLSCALEMYDMYLAQAKVAVESPPSPQVISQFTAARDSLKQELEAGAACLSEPDLRELKKQQQKEIREQLSRMNDEIKKGKAFELRESKRKEEENILEQLKEERRLAAKRDSEREAELRKALMLSEVTNPFKFHIKEGGPRCYRGITSNGNAQIQQSCISWSHLEPSKVRTLHDFCEDHPLLLNIHHVAHILDRDGLLITDQVYTLDEFLDNELERLNPTSLQDWWAGIQNDFRVIFRDVVEAIEFIFDKGFVCGQLRDKIFVTPDKRGRVLPSLSGKSKKLTAAVMIDLANVIKRVVRYPQLKNVEFQSTDPLLPEDFVHCLTYYDNWKETVPADFRVLHPYWWTVNERIRFPNYLHRELKTNTTLKTKFQENVPPTSKFHHWRHDLTGRFKDIASKGDRKSEGGIVDQAQQTHTNSVKSKAGKMTVPKFTVASDLPRFHFAVYSHYNGGSPDVKKLSPAELEEKLSAAFPGFLILCFDVICSFTKSPKQSVITPRQLKNLLRYRDRDDVDRTFRHLQSSVKASTTVLRGLTSAEEQEKESRVFERLKKAVTNETISFSLTFHIEEGKIGCYHGRTQNSSFEIQHSYVLCSEEQRDMVSELYDICKSHVLLLSVHHMAQSENCDRYLVTERVSSLDEFLQMEYKKISPHSLQEWWNKIESSFRTIFRDVVEALEYLFNKELVCGGLSHSIFVTAGKRGRILPSMWKKRPGLVSLDMGDLMRVIKRVITYPLSVRAELRNLDLELPSELVHFLKYCKTWKRSVPADFWIVHPYWCTQEERIKFPYYLHKVMKSRRLKKAFQIVVPKGSEFENWRNCLTDRFEEIAGKGDNENEGVSGGEECGTVDVAKYRNESDLPRFFHAVYCHYNDPKGIRKLSDAQLEEMLSDNFRGCLVFFFEMLCSCVTKSLILQDALKEVSLFRDRDNVARKFSQFRLHDNVSVTQDAKLKLPTTLLWRKS